MESVRKEVKEERSSEASEAGREVASVASSGAAAMAFWGITCMIALLELRRLEGEIVNAHVGDDAS